MPMMHNNIHDETRAIALELIRMGLQSVGAELNLAVATSGGHKLEQELGEIARRALAANPTLPQHIQLKLRGLAHNADNSR